ncbi:MAG TPA: response regulator transcription factor [Candidatus Nitrosotalea sp.]|nr:response regulator transcription factor [Candidatus Nitrosotalea sp.]
MKTAADLIEPAVRRLLIVDGDPGTRRELRRACEQQAFQVVEAESSQLGLLRFEESSPSLVLLDSRLPDGSGLDLCRELRRLDADIPILIMGTSADEIDVVVALEVGADDYVTKPVRLRELLARMAAHLRKSRSNRGLQQRGRLEFKQLRLDLNERRVQRRAEASEPWEDLELTHTEFDLLAYLAVNAGRVLSRERILNTIWGYDYPIETRVIDVHVRNLRKKIEPEPSSPVLVLAVPGIGYRFTNSQD